MLTRKHGEGIHMIIERKGDDAGKIGYFYVELQSKECVIVPMDARLGIKMAGKKNYLDYYTSAAYRGTLPKFDNDVWLRLNTLINLIINRKSESQKWWAYYLNM
ncbi:MAG: hypothetical protein LBE13_08940 [Bacteroidales bacterium]|nr:hypothetical protein [Bacteroidales bacterium]